jgi:hypothetical protein
LNPPELRRGLRRLAAGSRVVPGKRLEQAGVINRGGRLTDRPGRRPGVFTLGIPCSCAYGRSGGQSPEGEVAALPLPVALPLLLPLPVRPRSTRRLAHR